MTRRALTIAFAFSAVPLCAAAPPPPPVPAASPTLASKTPSTLARAPIAAASRPVRRPMTAPERHVVDANRAATAEPDRSGFVNAAQVYPFAEGMLYHVYTSPGRVTDIALEPGETLGAVASGDTVRWVIGDATSGSGADKRTHVLVKPFAAGLATNLVITTDRRSYHLALTSTSASAMAALSWTYPQDQLIALRRTADREQAATPIASDIALEQLHFGYVVSGDQPSWRPLRAFDDGRQTFIEFPADLAVGEAPPLFLVDAKGGAQLVNYRVHGRFYVVDRLFDAAELRLGLKHQIVVRISRVGEGARQRRAS